MKAWKWSGSTLYLTLTLDGVGDQHHAPAALPLREGSTVYWTGGLVGPRVSLYWCGKSRPRRNSNLGPYRA
jgi:hypothetical protein